jgi:UDP-N-acetylmuramoyl-tripeptide--D-alanyl-D-alanine ligase
MEALSISEIVKAVNGTLLCGDETIKITAVSTNSKGLEEGSLFVPIVGERIDAHDFIEDAFSNGAIACFTSRHEVKNNEKIYIGVDDTKKALQDLGTCYRSRFHIPVIGITGSVGKTTTKEMVAAALETKYNVLKTEGNMNSQVGLPLMMLRIHSDHEIAVIEMGMSEEGEMAKLTPISRPEVAIMTNIGVSHIAQLKTKENIRKEKLNIINEFDTNSILYINGNDELLSQLYCYSDDYNTVDNTYNDPNKENIENIVNSEDKENKENNENKKNKENSHMDVKLDISETTLPKLLHSKVIAFGTDNFCDYRAENIQTIQGKTHFILKKSSKVLEIENKNDESDKDEEIILQVLGLHNVQNALAALAVAEHYGIPVSVAKEGLRNYSPIAMRGQIKESNGIKIIDDSYNASPDSMKSGIQVLLQLDGIKRRIAVLADVMELGEFSEKCHYEVGEYIAEQKIHEVVTIGKDSKFITDAINDKNKLIATHHFVNNNEAIHYLQENLQKGDGVLVKGSRSMHTDEIVKAL